MKTMGATEEASSDGLEKRVERCNWLPIKWEIIQLSAAKNLILILGLLFWCAPALAQEPPAPRFKAVAFDYFVIFDANSVTPEVERAFPGKGAEFTKMWRSKQFEYCYLRTITGRETDFFKVTEDALVYTAEAMKLELTPEMRKRLLDAYLTLKPWPDAAGALYKLRAAGVRIITVANFSGKMLQANADGAGMTGLF